MQRVLWAVEGGKQPDYGWSEMLPVGAMVANGRKPGVSGVSGVTGKQKRRNVIKLSYK